MFRFKKRHNEVIERIEDLKRSIDVLCEFIYELEEKMSTMNLTKLHDIVETSQDNAKKVNTMMLELKGIVSIARAMIPK